MPECHENSIFELESGDSLLFASHLRHRWRDGGSTVTNAVIVLSGFDEGERPGERHVTKEPSEKAEDAAPPKTANWKSAP